MRPNVTFTDRCPTAGLSAGASETRLATFPRLMANDLLSRGRMNSVQSRWPSLQVARTTAAKRLRERVLRATVIAMRSLWALVPE